MEKQIKNILDIDKLRVFQNFEAALSDIKGYMDTQHIHSSYDKHIEFKEDRIYVFQNYIDDQYIFIERHHLN
tara:strand:- start:200 stop:415 length:216 start_codon:yes stop_codon:yes gene_type:complete